MSKRVRKQKIGVGFTATAAVEKGGRDIIPTKVKREIFKRYKCCQYVNKESKKSCKSQWQLQIEHIKPVWAGGNNDIENLSLLCGQHNRYNYLKQSGRSSG